MQGRVSHLPILSHRANASWKLPVRLFPLSARPPTQVHVNGPWPLRVGHILVDGIEDLLLDLCDGVTV